MKRKHLFLLLLSMVTSGSVFGQAMNDPRLAGLDHFADSVLQEFHVAGFAVAVVQGNRMIYAKGFGYRDYDKKLPVTPHTVFPIASCTKAFTGALLGILSAEGRIDLDQPVLNYYPELRFYDDYTTAHVTARDMLTHRTGLPRHDQLEYFFDKTLPRDSLVYRIRYLQPSAELRQKAQYNNLMYITLGVLSEKLTHKTWEQNVQERLFGPLQMTESSFNFSGWQASKEHSLGYYRKNNLITPGQPENDPLNGPAGGINSSVSDLAKWLLVWLHDGKAGNEQVIPADYIAQATRPQMVTGNATYGLGWINSTSRGGHYQVEHGGDLPLFSSDVCFFPNGKESLGIVVLASQFGGYVTGMVRDYIADHLLNNHRTDLQPTNWLEVYKQYRAANNPPATKKSDDSRSEGACSHALKAYVGIYNNPGYGTIEIKLQGDSLSGIFNKTPLQLKHVSYDIFEARPGGKLIFGMNMDGYIKLIQMPLEDKVKPIVFIRR
jgi:CubicO group peptidase (beta-lactamase class C family)